MSKPKKEKFPELPHQIAEVYNSIPCSNDGMVCALDNLEKDQKLYGIKEMITFARKYHELNQ